MYHDPFMSIWLSDAYTAIHMPLMYHEPLMCIWLSDVCKVIYKNLMYHDPLMSIWLSDVYNNKDKQKLKYYGIVRH